MINTKNYMPTWIVHITDILSRNEITDSKFIATVTVVCTDSRKKKLKKLKKKLVTK